MYKLSEQTLRAIEGATGRSIDYIQSTPACQQRVDTERKCGAPAKFTGVRTEMEDCGIAGFVKMPKPIGTIK